MSDLIDMVISLKTRVDWKIEKHRERWKQAFRNTAAAFGPAGKGYPKIPKGKIHHAANIKTITAILCSAAPAAADNAERRR
ncbi:MULTISPECIES: hypothetical protein [unclassified Neisseria]|uniref:hypothetical protein n=1 Tax=unclassified Neisseria TaxID=2623750 RepID=UPI001072A7DB|nr:MULTISPECIES: hypothetical protein [unclassified Neisseria]MBF0804886.1 hypothetical protein [Neisseria sp. 19428wB4_WF04]TFU39402.1 hypothetical protein E4T99_11295 [Neisseria sp. WF04]